MDEVAEVAGFEPAGPVKDHGLANHRNNHSAILPLILVRPPGLEPGLRPRLEHTPFIRRAVYRLTYGRAVRVAGVGVEPTFAGL